MACCHADFAAVEGSDRGFTLGMPTFTFGSGVLAEAGDNAAELGLRRVALFTDKRLATGEHVAKVRQSLAAAYVDCGVMPTLVSGNTNVPVVMIAERASDMILRGD